MWCWDAKFQALAIVANSQLICSSVYQYWDISINKMSKIILYCHREVTFIGSSFGYVEANHASNLIKNELFLRKNSTNVNITIAVEKMGMATRFVECGEKSWDL